MAFGGGDPLLHPNICQILAAAREFGIVPNLTTSGAYFSVDNLRALKEHCGAVALSLEAVGTRYSARRRLGFAGFLRAVELLREQEIPTVFQVVVSADNLVDLPSIVDLALQHNLYGVIFLAYKPVGRGVGFDSSLATVSPLQVALVLADAFTRLSSHTRVGYDCCLSPVVAGMNVDVFGCGNADLEGCSALRGSVGISVDLEVLPCTFLGEKGLGNLRQSSLLAIWQGASAMAFRKSHRESMEGRPKCLKCRHASGCFGGCPEMDLGFCT
jgi:radical SAM protein with 4Fe4S-binding SPASM domain